MAEPLPLAIPCADGVVLGGHAWLAQAPRGMVVVNAATGVLARYYHRFAAFLADGGFDVLTYDYRGIGASRPARLRGCGYRWRDWGQQDFEAALQAAHARRRDGPLMVVGHSIGGYLPGLAPSAPLIDRLLTVGAQYAWWRDYAPAHRRRLLLKWHVAMPLLTALFGYFPGRRLGWLEDLPAGVAHEWSFRGPRMETTHPATSRAAVLAGFAAVRARILAVSITDDEFGTLPAVQRTLAYYTGAQRQLVRLPPAALGLPALGHFSLFHARHAGDAWVAMRQFLRTGANPWPALAVSHLTSPGPTMP